MKLLKLPLLFLLLFFVHMSALWLSSEFSDSDGSFTTVWFISGISVVFLLATSRRNIALITMSVGLSTYYLTNDLVASFVLASGNSIEAWIAATLISRIKTLEDDFKTYLNFLSSAFLASFANLFLVMPFLLLSSSPLIKDLPKTFLTLLVAHASSIIVIVPLFRAFKRMRAAKVKSPDYRMKMLLVTAGSLVVGATHFLNLPSVILFLAFPFVFAVGLYTDRFLTRFSAFIIIVMSLVAIGTGRGPYFQPTMELNLLSLQFFALPLILLSLAVITIKKNGSTKLPGITLSLALALTAILYHWLQTNEVEFDRSKTKKIASQSVAIIKSELSDFDNILKIGTSFASRQDKMTSRHWKELYQKFEFNRFHPSINALIYAEPAGKKILTRFSEPEDYFKRVGVDLAQEDNRSKAALKARDTGKPVLTKVLTSLVTKKNTMLFFSPVYKTYNVPETIEERRKSLKGWVVLPIDVNTFLKALVPKIESQRELDLLVFPKEHTNESIFKSAVNVLEGFRPEYNQEIEFFGNTYILSWSRSGNFVSEISNISSFVIFIGSSFSILMAILISLLQSTNRRAEEIAMEKTLLLMETQEEIRDLNLSLEQKVRERTQELELTLKEMKIKEEEKVNLLSREKAANESSKMKSEFLATMSHEIRTPIHGVIGMSELLQDTSLSSKQIEYVNAIKQSGEGLLGLVNDILDFSKIEIGKLEFININFELQALLEQIEKTFIYEAQEKGLKIIYDLEASLPPYLMGDPGRLRQIFLNLISNAIKFSTAGDIIVSGRLISEIEGIAKLRFEVSDHGSGISERFISKLFKPYSQIRSNESSKYGGSGLGLSICKNLVEMMNGSIGVTSEIGIGSTFWFEVHLPLGSQVYDSQPIVSNRDDVDYSHLKFLIAEDNLINQKLILNVMEKLSIKAEIASNGAEALKMLENNHYDLILMDCRMPVMDGYQTTKLIRTLRNDEKKFIPIIALTANNIEGGKKKCLESGMNDFLSKPMRINELEAMINKWVMPQNKQTSNVNKYLAIEDGESLFFELTQIFETSTRSSMKLINEYLVNKNLKGVSFEAHKMKSSALDLGRFALSERFSKLETAADKEQYEESLGIVKEIEGILARQPL